MYSPDNDTLSAGLLIARLVLGPIMAAHGSQKLFGWFGGYGLDGTGGFMESIGFRPGRTFAAAAGTSELVGGLLLTLGLLGPIGPALIIAVMVVAAVSVHWKHGLFASNNGIELPLVYGAAAMALALTGPGFYSLDAAFGLDSLWTPALAWSAIGVGLLGGAINLGLRRLAPSVSAA
jgi:putative oxidoreductase